MSTAPHIEKKTNQEKKIDDAVEKTFPASDPIATGRPTSTEPIQKPVDRKAPIISKEEIENARQGKGHTQNDRFKQRG